MREDNIIIRFITDILIIKSYGLTILIKNNTNIIGNKRINGNPVYNVGKRGQEILQIAYGI